MNKLLDYFKSKEDEKEEQEEVFELVFVDIKNTWEYKTVYCIKKNMYDEDLKYIAISYRWGELEEQYVKTPDYTAHITSFRLIHLILLCKLIANEPDLKEIQYLWIDAISVNQQNHSKKKETILKMNQIYKNASYILAVPDLHLKYLERNTANMEVLSLIGKHRDIIHQEIFNSINHSATSRIYNIKNVTPNSTKHINNNSNYHSIIQKLMNMDTVKENEELKKEIEKLRKEHEDMKKENEELKMEMKENELRKENEKKEELKKSYQFLAYLIEDWSNRAWVISEYQIAKDKYEQYKTPLKYIFISLLIDRLLPAKYFFSFTFSVDQHNSKNNPNINNNASVKCGEVNNSQTFIHFLESKFIQRSHINMIVGSNASRDEDRFHAILPSWNKYKHLIKNENTISNWKISDTISVRLKLFEVMKDDLWDKARLLYMCPILYGKPVLPSFSTSFQPHFIIKELDNIDYAHRLVLNCLSEYKDVSEYIKDYLHKKEYGSIFKQNLIDIQFNNQQQCYLSIKAKNYFIFNMSSSPVTIRPSKEELPDYSLKDNDDLKLIYIPFFTFDIPDIKHLFLLNNDNAMTPLLSGTLLLGNMDINRWIQVEIYKRKTYGKPSLCSTNGYIFNIY